MLLHGGRLPCSSSCHLVVAEIETMKSYRSQNSKTRWKADFGVQLWFGDASWWITVDSGVVWVDRCSLFIAAGHRGERESGWTAVSSLFIATGRRGERESGWTTVSCRWIVLASLLLPAAEANAS